MLQVDPPTTEPKPTPDPRRRQLFRRPPAPPGTNEGAPGRPASFYARVRAALAGGVPGQSGQYGGINPGGQMPTPPIGAPVPKPVPQGPPMPPGGIGIPGQSGQYGGINPGGQRPPWAQASDQFEKQYGGINPGGQRPPWAQARDQFEKQQNMVIEPALMAAVPPVGQMPGEGGRYGGINPGGQPRPRWDVPFY